MAHSPLHLAVFQAQHRLALNNRELAQLAGTSLRTVERWTSARSLPYPDHITRIAAAVHAVDPAVAAHLAALIGQSLESLGLVQAPPAPAVAAPALAIVEAPLPAPDPAIAVVASLAPVLVESIVAAAAEALESTPRSVRPAVLAVIERAKATRLSLDDILGVLRPAPPAPAPATPAPAKRAKG
jgi:hypothetical protein